ncbi:GAF domain-containing sensor histidine kinase [Nostoc sp. 'Lobaria pulmonaria (5183) cyanobiont']|uniref:GAF domain-containing sensor histidine kinase n=1 Tax=Nostoc sp. 'Lobaria pulmonaria (5183) cyanobiont' TaxID=1618022 RepID=UPI000CF32B1A|nr:ATP-binding protein [Nostoc sp. 'Lobaria pulmonaria (5183) cyanobiont']AVH70070.1 histidine kinase [Nostoc sp. 'Lobaria pulmonaria (5183) cyanobiont']
MSAVSLRKMLNKKELPSLLHNLIYQFNIAIDVELVDGTKLISIGEQTVENRYPIEVSGEIIGWVVGEEQATLLATLLSFLAKQEAEKKVLAKELLERYQEIDLFDDISTQLTTSLDTRQIAQLVLQELGQLIESSAGMILLLSSDATAFEIIAEFGVFFDRSQPQPGKGIIGNIVQSNRAELVNDVQADPRLEGQKNVSAMICVPLRAKERVLGAIAIGTAKTDSYKAEHLKLVSIFASQTAIAIDKAVLYEQSTQAAVQAKAQTQRLQQALHELQLAQTQLIQSEKMSSLGQLIAGVAHEINNPVNFICGNLKYVAEYAQDLLHLLEKYQKFLPVAPPELESELDNIDLEFIMQDFPKLLDSMKLGTGRIVEIVQSLKNFSRHDEAEMKAVNIHDGIDGTLMILHHRVKADVHRPAIEIVKDYAKLPLIECYPGQLNQVFMNILANAIDALEESMENSEVRSSPQSPNPNPQITIRTKALDQQWVVIRIADNGPGMKEEVIRRIYDPFFTTKDVGKGTGLGMAISYQIVVDRHGGMLKCRSQPGEGTEFWIQIPLNCAFVDATEEHNCTSASPIHTTESSPTPDADGFIPSTAPMLKPTDLLSRHTQLIQRLSQHSPDVEGASPDQIYQMFQRHPISLKLYATLLSWFCCFNPTQIRH